jgi:hypothetical protein
MIALTNIGIILSVISGGVLTGMKALKYLQEEDNLDLKNNHLYFSIGIFIFHIFIIASLFSLL